MKLWHLARSNSAINMMLALIESYICTTRGPPGPTEISTSWQVMTCSHKKM